MEASRPLRLRKHPRQKCLWTDPGSEAEPASEEAPATPEEVGEKLRKMGAALTLRCVLGGILAAVLLHFGLVAEGLLAPLAALDL